MKIFLPLLFFSIASPIFALPCPNGSGILYKGDSVEETIRQCGQPTNKKTSTKTISSEQNWVYYRRHIYDRGYSQMVVTFRNERVAGITITDRYWFPVCQQAAVQVGALITMQTSCGDWSYSTAFTNFCGAAFGLGDAQQTVEAYCGLPAARSNLQSQTIESTELTYGTTQPQTIVFENGKLVDWR